MESAKSCQNGGYAKASTLDLGCYQLETLGAVSSRQANFLVYCTFGHNRHGVCKVSKTNRNKLSWRASCKILQNLIRLDMYTKK